MTNDEAWAKALRVAGSGASTTISGDVPPWYAVGIMTIPAPIFGITQHPTHTQLGRGRSWEKAFEDAAWNGYPDPTPDPIMDWSPPEPNRWWLFKRWTFEVWCDFWLGHTPVQNGHYDAYSGESDGWWECSNCGKYLS